MSIILIGKLFVGGLVIAGTSVSMAFGYPYLKGYFDNNIYIYAITTTVADVPSATILTYNDATRNYKCNIGSAVTRTSENELATEFSCDIVQLKEAHTTNKHVSFLELDTGNIALNEDNLKAPNNIYKLIIPKDKYDWTQNKNKSIEIVSTAADKKKYAQLTPLFAVDSYGKKLGTSEHFVVKSPEIRESLSSISTTDKYQCSWDVNPQEFKDCELHDFASTEPVSGPTLTDSSGYENLIFKTPSKSTAITKNKHYVIKFTAKPSPTEDNLSQNQIIFIKKDNKDETATFINIKPSFLIGTDNLLIINQ